MTALNGVIFLKIFIMTHCSDLGRVSLSITINLWFTTFGTYRFEGRRKQVIEIVADAPGKKPLETVAYPPVGLPQILNAPFTQKGPAGRAGVGRVIRLTHWPSQLNLRHHP